MTPRLQIDCVMKDERRDAYQRIVRVGGPNLPGIPPPDASRVLAELRRRGFVPLSERPRWTLSIEDAIEGMVAGKWSFYIQLGAYDIVNVHVATSPAGRFYLKTEADHDTPDELLFLPRCQGLSTT